MGIATRLRSALRHSYLSAVGSLTRPTPRGLVRLFYGHSLPARSVPKFRANLRMLRDHFEFVSVSEAVALCRASEGPDGRFAAFTFDDGFLDNFEHVAPVLNDFGARACFFVSTNFIGSSDDYRSRFLTDRVHRPLSLKAMSWAQVRELSAAGFEIGGHTMDHVRLSEVSPAEAIRQVVGCKDAVEANVGKSCDYFSIPYGYPGDVPEALVPEIASHFQAVFSAIRSRHSFSYGGLVVNRDHFEPDWPEAHVRYFATRPMRVGSSGGPPGFKNAGINMGRSFGPVTGEVER